MSISIRVGISGSLSAMFLLAGASSCSPSQVDNLEATNATLAYLESSYGRVDRLAVDRLMRRVSRKLINARYGLQTYPEYKSIDVERINSLPWQIHVVGDRGINAYAIGSGVLVITKGMLRSLDSEAMLAAVIAHEMSHELLGHTTEALITHEDETAVFQHYDLGQEISSDTLSALLLHAAGYEPEAAIEALVTVQQKMPASETPRFAKRIAALKKKVDELPAARPYIVNTREFNRVRKSL